MPSREHGYAVRRDGKQDKTYTCWMNMIHRCTKLYCAEYKNYGARGITICERWMSFNNFLADMGEKPDGLSLDRKDNRLGYSPENCRWATPVEQARNTRAFIVLDYQGESLPIDEWALRLGIPRRTLYFRYFRGWSVDRLLTQPLQLKRRAK